MGFDGDERSTVQCSIITMSRSAFFVISPACNDGVVVDGGAVISVIISMTVCLKKLSRLTLDKV